jgi:hypothetical protein
MLDTVWLVCGLTSTQALCNACQMGASGHVQNSCSAAPCKACWWIWRQVDKSVIRLALSDAMQAHAQLPPGHAPSTLEQTVGAPETAVSIIRVQPDAPKRLKVTAATPVAARSAAVPTAPPLPVPSAHASPIQSSKEQLRHLAAEYAKQAHAVRCSVQETVDLARGRADEAAALIAQLLSDVPTPHRSTSPIPADSRASPVPPAHARRSAQGSTINSELRRLDTAACNAAHCWEASANGFAADAASECVSFSYIFACAAIISAVLEGLPHWLAQQHTLVVQSITADLANSTMCWRSTTSSQRSATCLQRAYRRDAEQVAGQSNQSLWHIDSMMQICAQMKDSMRACSTCDAGNVILLAHPDRAEACALVWHCHELICNRIV